VTDSEGNSANIRHDPEIVELARRQHGHVARRQLLDIGVSQGLIAGRLKSGAWVAVHSGVYCIGPRRADPVSRAAAAVLACGEGAALSHASAASLWGFLPRWTFPLEVIAQGQRERPGITAHRCPSLTRSDVRWHWGLRVTSPARTVLDLAPRLTRKQLTRLVNDARLDGHLKLASLEDVLARNPRHHGTKLLRPFVDHPTNPTRSPFEDDFRVFAEKYGLPEYETNVIVNGREVDVLFRRQGVIVELDGREFHMDEEAFEDDRERDTEYLRLGLLTVRITTKRMNGTPAAEAARLLEILEHRASL
jgi:very-short-patch-repair endonuclease